MTFEQALDAVKEFLGAEAEVSIWGSGEDAALVAIASGTLSEIAEAAELPRSVRDISASNVSFRLGSDPTVDVCFSPIASSERTCSGL